MPQGTSPYYSQKTHPQKNFTKPKNPLPSPLKFFIVLIELVDVSIKFPGARDFALKLVSLSIRQNEIIGLLAPSGAGKSLLGNLIAGFLPKEAIPCGKIIYHFSDQVVEFNLEQSPFHFPENIQRHIAMIFQNPQEALNPSMKCGKQITEALWYIKNKKNRKKKALDLLERVQFKQVSRAFDAYPHQLSGGQQQRILIAIALAKKTQLLIADEPTTALDLHIQFEILSLIKEIKKEENLTILWTTHDKSVMFDMADRVFDLEHHVFIPKTKRPKSLAPVTKPAYKEDKIILSVQQISKSYQQKKHRIQAIHQISFQLHQGEILGIIGQSGSGKSTIAKILSGIEKADEGHFSLAHPKEKNNIQMIFQNPATSLEPTMLILDAVQEVLRYNPPNTKSAQELLQELDIDESLFSRFPSELSGGQQQRVAIAKALAANPSILILDEPTASLDQATSVQVNSLIRSIAANQKIPMIYISHELNNIYLLAHNLLIIKDGAIIETGKTEDIFSHPKHEYTKILVNKYLGSIQS
ncbi:MAG TPA: ABC transporter ATP-binding protein [Saprospiraceae bacterium]|nr:ABC transporter ATP-binding protein [Saprospiraceae bacterium]